MADVYVLKFIDREDLESACDSLILSLVSAEAIHGKFNVKVDCGIRPDFGDNTLSIVKSETGRHAALVLMAFLNRDIGEMNYEVKRGVLPPSQLTINGISELTGFAKDMRFDERTPLEEVPQ